MNLDEARGLKAQALTTILKPALLDQVKSFLAVSIFESLMRPGPGLQIAIGIASSGSSERDFKLAVRVAAAEMLDHPVIARLRQLTLGEVDVQNVGRVVPRVDVGPEDGVGAVTVPWHQQRSRPLRIGCSVGHCEDGAGTIGAFVRSAEGKLFILSNCHVLARSGMAKRSDAILQAGKLDLGANPTDLIAKLSDFRPFSRVRENVIDAAIAAMEVGIEAEFAELGDLNMKLRGTSARLLEHELRVAKVGRTSGATRGKVVAYDVDRVTIDYDGTLGKLKFDNQIEIESLDGTPFSKDGDSGALVVDEDGGAVGLLFAGTANDDSAVREKSYANPIQTVLSEMNVSLALSG